MPKILISHDGVRETVTRPIVFNISRQLVEWTGLEQMRILFAGDTEMAVQPGSTIDQDVSFNHTSSEPLWKVKIKEEHRREMLLATAVHQSEHPDYFLDAALGVSLRPVYSPVLLTFDFEFRTADVNSARRWLDEFRTRVSAGRDVSRTHIINYSYMIPKEVFPLIKHIHELREAQAGYGEDYETYLDKCFTKNVTETVKLSGDEPRYTITEQQGRVTGQFAFEELPDDAEKKGETSAYTLGFSYKIYFDSPISTAVDYPVLVHNQLINQEWIYFQPKDDAQAYASRMQHSLNALSAFEVDKLAKPTVKSGIRLPEFHEFYPASAPRATLQVLSALVGIENPEDNPDNRKIMNFNEIDENWEFRPEFINHLKYDYKYLHKYGESLVNITVYDNHMPLHHSMFTVDSELNVILNFEPDLRKTYYVRLSLLTDPTELSPAAVDRARENAEGLIIIGVVLCPNLVKHGLLPKILGNTNYVSRVEGNKFLQRIKQCTNSHNGGVLSDHSTISWNTVMILYIETNRKQDNNT